MQAALEHSNDECIHEKSGQTTCSHNRVHLCLGRALDDILRGLPRAAANGDDDMPGNCNFDCADFMNDGGDCLDEVEKLVTLGVRHGHVPQHALQGVKHFFCGA